MQQRVVTPAAAVPAVRAQSASHDAVLLSTDRSSCVLQGKEATQNVWMPQTPEPEQDMLDGTPGSINVSSILTGKLVAKVSAVAKPRTFRERKVSDALTGACILQLPEGV